MKTKMRVCPKCHYVDSAYWRYSFMDQIDYTELENFKLLHPELVDELLRKKTIADFDEIYAYHLTKGGNVERQAILQNPTWHIRWHPFGSRESHSKKKTGMSKHLSTLYTPRRQRKLFEKPTQE